MRMIVLGTVVLILAAGGGALRAFQETSVGGELFQPYDSQATTPNSGAPKRIVAVNGDHFEFGTLQRGTKMNHDFLIQNVSDHPIEIWVGESSCTCTVASLSGGQKNLDPAEKGTGDTDERRKLQPGETTEITMEWEGLTANPKFFQTAEIYTDDADQKSLRLIVSGSVQSAVSITPDAIQMNNVSVKDGAASTTTVATVMETFPEVKEAEFMVKDTADLFDLVWEPSDRPLVDGNKSARRLVIRAKPGLPIGTVSQRLRLLLDLNGDNTLYVPITAKVESELSILGPSEYVSKAGLLRWGVVERDSGRESTLYVLVKGDRKETVDLQLESMDPEGALDIEILPVKNPDARTWTIPVKVRLRADSPPVSRLGGEVSEYGTVRLRTGHPVAKHLQFRIQFAVN